MSRLAPILILILFCAPAASARQEPAPAAPVASGVYPWHPPAEPETGPGESILAGSTTDLAHLEIRAVVLAPGQAQDAGPPHDDFEELIIVKDGTLHVAIGDRRQALRPGSVAVVLPGDAHRFENAGDAPVSYHAFRYRSKAPVDVERGRDAGGSFTVDWNDVEMVKTATGGRRQHFDRATAMFERFEMHVSTLDEGLTNHAAHTHRAEEFVLIIRSEVEMLVGDAHREAAAGDLVFLDSMVPHNLRNTGQGPTEYFAFQWQ